MAMKRMFGSNINYNKNLMQLILFGPPYQYRQRHYVFWLSVWQFARPCVTKLLL